MKKTLTLYSSARATGNTFQLVKTFDQVMPTEVCYLDNMHIEGYDYQYRNQNDDFNGLVDKMLEADIIIFASPVYWYAFTPVFKSFFDRFTDLITLEQQKHKGKKLREKDFYVFATSAHDTPPASFISPLQNTLDYLGWQYRGLMHINCKMGFDPIVAKSLCERMAKSMKKSMESQPKPSFLSQLGRFAHYMSYYK